MCTVTFFPKNNHEWLLSTNRDEMKSREKASFPVNRSAEKQKYLAPIDQKAGGTWVAVNTAGVGLTLLNNYQGKNPLLDHRSDAVSRGLIIPNLMHLDNLDDMDLQMQELELSRFNPFKLIGIQSDPLSLTEWSWDGQNYRVRKLPVQPHLWVSTGKDYEGVLKNRKQVFDQFRENHPDPSTEDIKELHASDYPESGAYSIAMELDIVSTVSNTIVEKGKKGINMLYHDGKPVIPGKWAAVELMS